MSKGTSQPRLAGPSLPRAGGRGETGGCRLLLQLARTAVVIGAVLFTHTSPAFAAKKRPVHLPIKTVSIPIWHQIQFAQHVDARQLSEKIVDNHLWLAGEILQKKDGPNDVACPVAFERQGPLDPFEDPAGYDLDEINTKEELRALLVEIDPDKIAFLAERIHYCGEPPPKPGTLIAGCAIGQALMIFPNAVSDEESPWDSWTFAHEFGHIQKLDNVESSDKVMFKGLDEWKATGDEDEVDAGECDAFKRPLP